MKIWVSEQSIIPIFHSMPMHHKVGFPPSFYPIVSGIGSLNEQMCAWVDSLLQPLIKGKRHKTSGLNAIFTIARKLFMTADVTSLYSVIPHDLAGIVLMWFLDVFSNYTVELKKYLVKVVCYFLKHNFFMFKNTFYLKLLEHLWGRNFHLLWQMYLWHSRKNIFLFDARNLFLRCFVWYGGYSHTRL